MDFFGFLFKLWYILVLILLYAINSRIIDLKVSNKNLLEEARISRKLKFMEREGIEPDKCSEFYKKAIEEYFDTLKQGGDTSRYFFQGNGAPFAGASIDNYEFINAMGDIIWIKVQRGSQLNDPPVQRIYRFRMVDKYIYEVVLDLSYGK